MIYFAVQYGFEFIGVYPTYLVSELVIQEVFQKYSPLIPPALQSRFLSLFTDYHSALVKKVRRQVVGIMLRATRSGNCSPNITVTHCIKQHCVERFPMS